MTTDQLVAGANGLWAGSAFIVVTLAVLALWRQRGRMLRESRVLCVGAVLSGIGVVLHRGYWNLGIWLRKEGSTYADWAADWRWVPSAAVMLIVCGAVIALRLYGQAIFGRYWWPYVAVTLLVSSFGSAALAGFG